MSRKAIKCSGDFVTSLMRVLSDSQIKALEKEGVYKQLRQLVMHYDEMSADDPEADCDRRGDICGGVGWVRCLS